MKIILLVVISCFLFACAGKAINTDDLLVLEYYPDCDYQIIGKVRGKDGPTSYSDGRRPTTTRTAQGNREIALYNLKKNAIDKGADAIAINYFTKQVNREINRQGANIRLDTYVYEAMAIKLCSSPPEIPYNTANLKPVPLDELGNIIMSTLISRIRMEIIFGGQSEEGDYVNPEISNHEIDSSGSIFGLSLGITKKKLLAVLGRPSVIITESKGKEVIQYGRRHLFYMLNNEFVAYKYSDWLLPPHINNKVLFHDQFEPLRWTLDNKITLGDTFEEVEAFYGDQLIKESTGHYVMKSKEVDVTLTFHKEKYPYTEEVSYTLANVGVSKKNVYFNDWNEIIATNKFERSVDINKSFLPIMPNDSPNQVIAKLGNPNAIFKNRRGKLSWAYDNDLIIRFFKGRVFNYSFESSSFKHSMDECNSCLYLGQNKQSIPTEHITVSTENDFSLENNGIVYTVDFSNAGGVRRIEKINITSKI